MSSNDHSQHQETAEQSAVRAHTLAGRAEVSGLAMMETARQPSTSSSVIAIDWLND
jgi:hypothetical protein